MLKCKRGFLTLNKPEIVNDNITTATLSVYNQQMVTQGSTGWL